ncbi:effector-associated constant component EACC1 [Streptosporangium sp. CA-115845]|uniref:effector-associated constant component EACC1 n=1 Tax=Streptosporangium sp. CA-115845 TaxID=3240071 RepID=UPI003D8AF456
MTVTAENSADELRNLYSWLKEEPELRGQVRVREGAPPPGALGPVVDGLQVALGAGGAGTAPAGVLIAWLRTRGEEVNLTLTRGENETRVEVTAKGGKALNPVETRALTTQLVEVPKRTEARDGDD